MQENVFSPAKTMTPLGQIASFKRPRLLRNVWVPSRNHVSGILPMSPTMWGFFVELRFPRRCAAPERKKKSPRFWTHFFAKNHKKTCIFVYFGPKTTYIVKIHVLGPKTHVGPGPSPGPGQWAKNRSRGPKKSDFCPGTCVPKYDQDPAGATSKRCRSMVFIASKLRIGRGSPGPPASRFAEASSGPVGSRKIMHFHVFWSQNHVYRQK